MSYPLNGHMLRGVDYVELATGQGGSRRAETDGRVYMWSFGAVTVYPPGQPWCIYPAHRVRAIIGKEQG